MILKEIAEGWKKREGGRTAAVGASADLERAGAAGRERSGFDADKWYFTGMVEAQRRLIWDDFRALPQSDVKSDFRCVSRWSRLKNQW